MDRIAELGQSFANTFNSEMRTADKLPKIDVIRTGLPSFDTIIQDCGGLPRGRIVEGHGTEGSCKSTFATAVAAYGQKVDPNFTVLWLDVEGCFDPKWASKMGQDISRTMFPPDDIIWAEDYFKVVKWGIVNNIDLIVLDSLPALVPKSIGERTMERDAKGDIKKEQDVSKQDDDPLNMKEMLERAKILSQNFMPDMMSGFIWGKETYRLKLSKSCIYVVNQLRDNPNGRIQLGDSTPGGKAMRFLYSSRLQFRKTAVSKDTDKFGHPLNQTIHIKNIKNKVGTPFGEASYMLDINGGFYELDEGLLAAAIAKEVVMVGGGGYYTVDGTRVRGKELAIELLKKSGIMMGTFEKVEQPVFDYEDKRLNAEENTTSEMAFKRVQALLSQKG